MKIFLIDDSPSAIALMSMFLKCDPELQIVTFQDAAKALQSLSVDQPDLIVCDIRMPNMDGMEFTKLVRQRPEWNGVRIVAVTALAMESDRKRALEAGFDGYFTKPIDPYLFVEKLKEFAKKGVGNG